MNGGSGPGDCSGKTADREPVNSRMKGGPGDGQREPGRERAAILLGRERVMSDNSVSVNFGTMNNAGLLKRSKTRSNARGRAHTICSGPGIISNKK